MLLILYRYKISFVALDGTDEAEMVCFGDVARRIIGTATNANTYPPDVTKMVSLRFTFQVSLIQQSYYRQQKTYQVVSVVTSHVGQPNAIPHAPVNEDGAHPSTPESDHSLTAATDDGSELVTPNSVTDGGVPSPVATNVSSLHRFYALESCRCLMQLDLPSVADPTSISSH